MCNISSTLVWPVESCVIFAPFTEHWLIRFSADKKILKIFFCVQVCRSPASWSRKILSEWKPMKIEDRQID